MVPGVFLYRVYPIFFQVYKDLEVAFVISEEDYILKALSRAVELLEGNTAPINQYYYGCLFHELLAFQLADRHPPAQVCSLAVISVIMIISFCKLEAKNAINLVHALQSHRCISRSGIQELLLSL